MNTLKLKALTPEVEDRFWQLAETDIFDHYFFVYDWRLHRDKTEIYLAMDSEAIVGAMLVYEGSIVQLRGGEDAVAFLLSNLILEKADVQVPECCEDLLLAKYPVVKLKEHIKLLTVKRGEEHLKLTAIVEPLSLEDAPDVADLMHQSYPELWGETTSESVASRITTKEALWVGVKVGGELAAFGYAAKTPKVGHITWIATSPTHRGKGYASAVVSALLKEILSYSEAALIYVVEGNTVAEHIYESNGFKLHKRYVFVET